MYSPKPELKKFIDEITETIRKEYSEKCFEKLIENSFFSIDSVLNLSQETWSKMNLPKLIFNEIKKYSKESSVEQINQTESPKLHQRRFIDLKSARSLGEINSTGNSSLKKSPSSSQKDIRRRGNTTFASSQFITKKEEINLKSSRSLGDYSNINIQSLNIQNLNIENLNIANLNKEDSNSENLNGIVYVVGDKESIEDFISTEKKFERTKLKGEIFKRVIFFFLSFFEFISFLILYFI